MGLGWPEMGQMCSGQIVLDQIFSRIECGPGRMKPDQRILGRVGYGSDHFSSDKISLAKQKSGSKWFCADQVGFRWTWVGSGCVQLNLGQLKSDSSGVGMVHYMFELVSLYSLRP